jgi:hypothetical protein
VHAQIDRGHHETARIEPHVRRTRRRKTSEQQAGPGQQHETHSDFGNDERTAQRKASAALGTNDVSLQS